MRSRISGVIPTVERQVDRMEESPFDECRFHFTCGHVATTKGSAMDFESVSGVGTERASEQSFDVWCIATWRNQENAPWIAASTPHARGQWDRPMGVMVLVSRSVALCILIPRRTDEVGAASGSGARQ
jgi:hypothetical protein